MAGLCAAYQIGRTGRRVLVLDDGAIGGGETGRTTAHLTCAIDDRLVEVEEIRGTSAMIRAARSHAAAIEWFEAVVAREGIACDFRRLPGYLLPATADHQLLLARELDAALRADLDVTAVKDPPLPGYESGAGLGAIRFGAQGQFDPLAFLAGLADAVARHGGVVLTGHHVASVDDGSPVTVHLRDGGTVTAGAAVIATNTPINDRVVIHTKQFPYLTYVVGVAVPRNSLTPALYWDTGHPYHYCRIVPGPDHDILLVGGEDHKPGQAEDYSDRFGRLEDWARRRFPSATDVRVRWSGQVMETLDGLAYLGKNPGNERVFVATGDSGMGMTHSAIGAMLIADQIGDAANPWTDVYDPSRKPVRSLSRFATENLNAAVQYGDWLTGGEVDSIEAIPPGSGAVLRVGLKKLAVYRNPQGVATVCSAVCPHLKAIVRWNRAEQTWDCPAHGSRFDPTGRVVHGPANDDLTPDDVVAAVPATG
jgi:glycine/D-amino acid oxidase-like deaminating enzyme/nitrite reductase/ring-hydroxylating ferredoxin subunit